ncbi:Snf1-related kinase interactor 1 protein [Thalictrum thalictroides]|uniref:Snf1-related kinase interactor 1 protein n=1 Tax=Thalictrum thalictroides TaxID=46969 RepID=A0A7J6W764_THATH|nr:Snf1-related kinase interactor 1 protein [Thalictrum thalictroides]
MNSQQQNSHEDDDENNKFDHSLDGFSSTTSQTRVFWNSRKRSANGPNLSKTIEDFLNDVPMPNKEEDSSMDEKSSAIEKEIDFSTAPVISDRRKALFEPLEPSNARKLLSDELLVPPPDFDTSSYPKGWLIGKKRKLVNVDVVESMRRIAVQEMNRKDREINGLNEQLEEDAKVLEHLQVQLLQERSKRADVERENSVLQNQVSMLMNMLQEDEGVEEEDTQTQDS